MASDATATASRARRIGIMGGTFDPLHNGHLACAAAAQEALDLDEVLFIPCGIPSFKQETVNASAEDRLAMTRLGIVGREGYSVDDLEVERPGTTYTVDTLRTLRERYPETEFVFITGADAARTLPIWYRANDLAQLARFAVVARDGESLSAEEQRKLADAGFTIILLADVQTGDVSSHEIRSLVKAGKPIRSLVPEAIERYIIENGLYR